MTGATRRWALVAATWLALAAAPTQAAAGPPDPDALWKIVHGMCVPDQQQHANPAPCALVDLAPGEAGGFAVLKDINGVSQYLLIPTARVRGIESAAVLARGAPDYFAAAWRARRFVDQALKRPLPRDAVALAINSRLSRSQEQLHIHIDCVRADVLAALHEHQDEIKAKWSRFAYPLAGHRYRAMRVLGEQLDGVNPFALLADGVPGAVDAMGQQTLVVVGATFAAGGPGFILLDDQADLAAGDRAGGEALQDHACKIARPESE
jgi:CDP-diacylglycerol pyrophosphatase